jgi:hypothetical protein
LKAHGLSRENYIKQDKGAGNKYLGYNEMFLVRAVNYKVYKNAILYEEKRVLIFEALPFTTEISS